MHLRRSQFRQGRQHEKPVGDQRMGHGQGWALYHQVSVVEQVQINHPVLGQGAIPAQLRLDGEHGGEQLGGRQGGGNLAHRIGEPVVRVHPDRFCPVWAGEPDQADACRLAQPLPGEEQVSLAVAEIGAQPDKGLLRFFHGRIIYPASPARRTWCRGRWAGSLPRRRPGPRPGRSCPGCGPGG